MAKTNQNDQHRVKTYCVKVEGVSPILMNPATEELLDNLEFGAAMRKPLNKDMPTKEKAAKKIIRDSEGRIGIPVEYLFSCLREAGRHVIYDGKTKISTRETTLLPAFFTIHEGYFPFEDQNVEFVTDRRRGKLPKDGTAVAIIRPRFDKWSFIVTFDVDETPNSGIAIEKIRELFDKAGRMIGLGDFRPSCNGVFGRFRIAEWQEM